MQYGCKHILHTHPEAGVYLLFSAVYPDGEQEICKYVCSNKHYVLPDVRFNECHQVSPGPGGVKHLTLVNEVSDGGLAGLRWPGLVTTVMMEGLVTTVMGALAGGVGSPLAHNIGARSEAWEAFLLFKNIIYIYNWSKYVVKVV